MESKSKNEEALQIGGRPWRVVRNSTLEHDFETMRLARAMGLQDAGQLPEETPQDFAERLVFQLTDSGRAFDYLGCLLLPANVPDDKWTPEEGQRTAAFMRMLTAPADKAEVQGLVATLLISFFGEGLRFCGVSSAALKAVAQPGEQPNSNASGSAAST